MTLRTILFGARAKIHEASRRRSARMQKTHMARWRANMHVAPPWDDRNTYIASLVPDGAAVLDVGAGAQSLRAHLPPSCRYQPCDVVAKTPDTWEIDFNRGIYPTVSDRFDVGVLSGVLEYARDPEPLLRWLALHCRTLIASYVPADSGTRSEREYHGWLSHLTRSQMEDLFAAAGLRTENMAHWGGALVYVLASAGRRESDADASYR